MDITSVAFWGAFGSIILADILLSGDNAVVIALATRSLPPKQQKQAIIWGSAAAIMMRIALTLVAVELLKYPYLKLIGGALLLYIGVTLMLEEEDIDEGKAPEMKGLLAAVRTILVADLAMSLDNVLAVAAAAKGNTLLLMIGLGLSIPLIVFGSTLLLKVMERFPIIITVGAAVLGFLAGEMIVTDPVVKQWFGALPHGTATASGLIGAVAVVAVGTWLHRRGKTQATEQA